MSVYINILIAESKNIHTKISIKYLDFVENQLVDFLSAFCHCQTLKIEHWNIGRILGKYFCHTFELAKFENLSFSKSKIVEHPKSNDSYVANLFHGLSKKAVVCQHFSQFVNFSNGPSKANLKKILKENGLSQVKVVESMD